MRVTFKLTKMMTHGIFKGVKYIRGILRESNNIPGTKRESKNTRDKLMKSKNTGILPEPYGSRETPGTLREKKCLVLKEPPKSSSTKHVKYIQKLRLLRVPKILYLN